MNHWVIGVPIEGHCIDVDDMADGVVGDSKLYADAGLAAGRVGWGLKGTDCYGNCCVDALTHHDHKPRSQENWMAIRNEIAQPWKASPTKICGMIAGRFVKRRAYQHQNQSLRRPRSLGSPKGWRSPR